MSKKYRKRVILADVETVEGTDAAPAAVNAIRCSDPEIQPMAGSTVKRRLLMPHFGATPDVHVGLHQTVSFSVELAGSGTAGTAPAYGPLLRMCGFAETVNAAVDVQYDPVSADEESGTIHFNMDGILHPLVGARGTVKLMCPPDDLPHLDFTFTGTWGAPTDTAQVTPDFSAFVDAVAISKQNTPTFDIHGYSAVLESLELDLGNAIAHRNRVNSERVHLTDRQMAGSLSIEAPALGTKDFFAIAAADTLGALQLIHGTTAGNIVQVDSPKVQILQPGYSNADNLALLTANLSLTPDTGDDEFKLTVK